MLNNTIKNNKPRYVYADFSFIFTNPGYKPSQPRIQTLPTTDTNPPNPGYLLRDVLGGVDEAIYVVFPEDQPVVRVENSGLGHGSAVHKGFRPLAGVYAMWHVCECVMEEVVALVCGWSF